MGHLTSTKTTIMKLYEQDREIVNDDARLISTIWLDAGWDGNNTLLENLRKVPHPETITRARRMLHVEEKIVYSKKAEGRRYKRFTEIKDETVDPTEKTMHEFLDHDPEPYDFDKMGL